MTNNLILEPGYVYEAENLIHQPYWIELSSGYNYSGTITLLPSTKILVLERRFSERAGLSFLKILLDSGEIIFCPMPTMQSHLAFRKIDLATK